MTVRAAAVLCALAVFAGGAQAEALPSIEAKVAGATRLEGYFDLYWHAASGRMYWALEEKQTEFLYQVSMASGLGSNPVGIDRGQTRGTYVLKAERVGPRLLLVQPNYRFRASSDNALERVAVLDAFATSVLWGFDLVAEDDDRVLVDATDFFLRDARDVIGQLKRREQGTFTLDPERSAFHLPRTKAFPENVEVEVTLTFTSDDPGELVRKVAASGGAVTLRQHHSLMKLPDDNFQPRIADPRIGTNGPTIQDYGAAIDQDLVVRLVARHRLVKKDPLAARSEAIEPIVYYVDSGVPEPIRGALIEGARWWNDAFEAAGFINAFRVQPLPDGADPQDVRYNMIHWTHRRTRGYSYGSSVIDPRTGEILKGNVNLGSLRLRQDYLHGQGLVPAFDYLGATSGDTSASVEMALARVRQLSAHEVGHTLGYPHNYLASTYGRESVMDYPAPRVEIDAEGKIDLSQAYVQRIGEYDKLAIRYSYSQFPPGADEQAELAKIVQESLDRGLIFMAHTNNNFVGAAHQYASVWDNGENLVDQLEHEIEVRRIGLASFGPEVIRKGEPLSTLEYVLLPLYMHHRFQLNAAAQSIGGADFRYAARGDGQTPVTIVAGAEQRRALKVLLATLAVDFLALPESLLDQLPPPAFRFAQGEAFPGRTALPFDPLGAAEAAASFTVQTLLHPARMARLATYGALGDYPDLAEVADQLLTATWDAPRSDDAYRQQIQNVVQRVTVDEMLRQAAQPENAAEVRAVLSVHLDALAGKLERINDASAHEQTVAADIRRWQRRLSSDEPAPALKMPPGDPI
ncbi:MAG: zinc-dependent metalloprotease [Pseudomonadota bacterium]